MSHLTDTIKKGRSQQYNQRNQFLEDLSLQVFFNQDRKKQKNNKPAMNHFSIIQAMLSSLVYPCCGEKMLQSNSNQKNYLMQHDLYLMPCEHNMCQNCICKKINSRGNIFLICHATQCKRKYSIQQAQQHFIKNRSIRSFLQKLCLYFSQIKQNPFRPQNSINSTIQKHCHNPFPISFTNSHTFLTSPSTLPPRMQIQPDTKSQTAHSPYSHSSSSQDQTFNPCINIFCKKPTLSLYCTVECEAFDEQLEQLNNNRWNEQNERGLRKNSIEINNGQQSFQGVRNGGQLQRRGNSFFRN